MDKLKRQSSDKLGCEAHTEFKYLNVSTLFNLWGQFNSLEHTRTSQELSMVEFIHNYFYFFIYLLIILYVDDFSNQRVINNRLLREEEDKVKKLNPQTGLSVSVKPRIGSLYSDAIGKPEVWDIPKSFGAQKILV